ncbi:MAG: DUF2273 domain-containing protein [Actinomycetota bacterium]
MKLTSKHIGILLGFGFGWIVVQHGFVKAVFVLAMAAIGWVIGRVLDGEIDVSQYIRRGGVDDLE